MTILHGRICRLTPGFVSSKRADAVRKRSALFRFVAMFGMALFMGTGAASQTVPQLLHRFQFDGAVADEAGNAVGVLLNGAQIAQGRLWTDGINDSLDFDRCLIPGSGSVSIALWAFPARAGGGQYQELISQGGSPDGGQSCFYVGRDRDDDRFRIGDQWLVTDVPYDRLVGSWHHLVVVVDRSRNVTEFWIDGALMGTRAVAIQVSTRGVTAVGRQYCCGEHFHGMIDDLRVYSGALSGVEIQSMADSDGDGINDPLDNCPTHPNPQQADCDNDGEGDACELAGGASDCNANGIPDACDIASGLSRDTDQDGKPDECELDCNRNGSFDDYDIATSASADCNGNGIPDECEDGSASATTGSMGRFGNGVTASGTLGTMLPSVTPVTVTVRARGDLNGATEFAVVKFAGITVANFFVAGGTDCPSGFDSETFTLSAAAWNGMVAASQGGNVAVTVTGSPLVDANQCSDGSVEVLISYKSSRYDCNGDGLSDLCQIASGFLPDCNQNGVPDGCDISAGTVADIDQNGVPDTCQPDCNANGLPDAYELSRGLAVDCNGNGKPDSCDIASGVSTDFDQNGVPDSCQPDCNGNGKPDAWEVAAGLVPDCNANGQPDSCDIAAGLPDVDGNGVPDGCQGDCNANGKPDSWEIATGQALDCNINGLPDACDVASGAAGDCNANGIPDSCDITAGELDDDADGRIDACELAYGDLDLDGEVTAGDIAFVLLIFGDLNPVFGDLDGDGVITSGDISIMLLNFGPVPF
jgi:hypothetical protein